VQGVIRRLAGISRSSPYTRGLSNRRTSSESLDVTAVTEFNVTHVTWEYQPSIKCGLPAGQRGNRDGVPSNIE